MAGESPDKVERGKSSGETTGEGRTVASARAEEPVASPGGKASPASGAGAAEPPAQTGGTRSAKPAGGGSAKGGKAAKGAGRKKAKPAAKGAAAAKNAGQDAAGSAAGEEPVDAAEAAGTPLPEAVDQPQGEGSSAPAEQPESGSGAGGGEPAGGARSAEDEASAERDDAVAGSEDPGQSGGYGGNDERLKAAVAAWVAGAGDGAADNSGPEHGDSGRAERKTSQSAAQSRTDGDEAADGPGKSASAAASAAAEGVDNPTAMFRNLDAETASPADEDSEAAARRAERMTAAFFGPAKAAAAKSAPDESDAAGGAGGDGGAGAGSAPEAAAETAADAGTDAEAGTPSGTRTGTEAGPETSPEKGPGQTEEPAGSGQPDAAGAEPQTTVDAPTTAFRSPAAPAKKRTHADQATAVFRTVDPDAAGKPPAAGEAGAAGATGADTSGGAGERGETDGDDAETSAAADAESSAAKDAATDSAQGAETGPAPRGDESAASGAETPAGSAEAAETGSGGPGGKAGDTERATEADKSTEAAESAEAAESTEALDAAGSAASADSDAATDAGTDASGSAKQSDAATTSLPVPDDATTQLPRPVDPRLAVSARSAARESAPAEKPGGTEAGGAAAGKPGAGKAGPDPATGAEKDGGAAKPEASAAESTAGTAATKSPGSAPEESDAERTSKFVPLRSADAPPRPARKPAVPAGPPQPLGSPAAAPPGELPPEESAPSLSEAERTRREVRPDQAPLDLLAQLTNTPPPPETPLRTAVRRVKIWTPLVLLVVVLFAVAQAVRPLPEPELSLTASPTYTFQGEKPAVEWPTEGQARLDVQGLGSFGSSGEQKPVPIASVAKVMTAYVILRDHPVKKGSKGALIPVDKKAEEEAGLSAQNESTVEVEEGDKLTEREAIEAIMIASANNVARLLARWDAGSEKAFAKKMNAAAKDLGMKNTEYTDPSGLTASTVSTAEDQVKLAKKAMGIDLFREVVRQPGYTDGNGEQHGNWNKLVPLDGVVGIKTGTTTKAGGNLLFAAEKEVGGTKQLIVGAVLGQYRPSILDTVLAESKRLIDTAQDAIRAQQVVRKGEVVGYVDDQLGGRTPVVATKDVTAVGWSGLKVKLALTDGGKPLPHEGSAGDRAGTLTVGDGPGQVRVPLALKEDMSEPGFGAKLTRIL